MDALTPTQLAALRAAAADSKQQLQRRRGGYASDGGIPNLHSARSVQALQRLGLLTESEPGFQARYTLTPTGRDVLAGFQRAEQRIAQRVPA